MKTIILSFLFFSIHTSLIVAQEIKKCKSGIFFIERKDEIVNFELVKNGEIMPSRNQQEGRAYPFFNRSFCRYELKQYPDIIQNNKVETKLINTKAKLVICYDSFKEQYLPFALGKVNEFTLISQKGIPFLTFTRVE